MKVLRIAAPIFRVIQKKNNIVSQVAKIKVTHDKQMLQIPYHNFVKYLKSVYISTKRIYNSKYYTSIIILRSRELHFQKSNMKFIGKYFNIEVNCI